MHCFNKRHGNKRKKENNEVNTNEEMVVGMENEESREEKRIVVEY